MQSRRIAPRVPYDEAVCLARTDGRGRLYTRGLDLSCSGVSVVCSESVPVGTEVRATLLLPGGPRTVAGRVVRVTALRRGVGLAVTFDKLKPGTEAAIARVVEAASAGVQPAKLRVDGIERPLRCEGRIDDGTVRLTASLPFLRLEGGVDVVLGEAGEVTAAGVIRKIGLDPATRDGVPRLAVEVALARDGRAPQAATPEPLFDGGLTPPPTKLPPPCGHPLPSVVVSRTFERDVVRAEERPPRRRVHGTAEIPRRAVFSDWTWEPPPALVAAPMAIRDTSRVETELAHGSAAARFLGFAVLATISAFGVAALLARMI
jgi:hypothetical protein